MSKDLETVSMFDIDQSDTIDKKLALSKSFSSKQLKAISWYADDNDLKLQLCNPPMQMNFIEKETGMDLTVTLQTILDEYKEWNDNDKKQRAQARKLEKDQKQLAEKGLLRDDR